MKTIAEIKAEFAAAEMRSYPALYEMYKDDTRSGVQKLIEQCYKKEAALEKEKLRIEKMKEYERKYEHLGYLCGIDEVGRGPIAGPLVVCGVVLPINFEDERINDSKKLSDQKRRDLVSLIKENALWYDIYVVDIAMIERYNIYQATKSTLFLRIL